MGECIPPHSRRVPVTRSGCTSGSLRRRPSRRWMFRISLLLAVFIVSTLGYHNTRAQEYNYNGNYHASRSLLATSSNENVTCGVDNPNLPFWEQCEYECDTIPALWVFLYAVLIIILFIGLAIVCDEFFVPSLEAISEKLDLSEDVAGATFMAAGSSAPELFTSILGVSFSSDVGVGTIVGSAVFNILIIIALTAALAGKVLVLDPRPLIRDSIFYGLSIICFILFCWDGQLMWWESAILLTLYAVYIAIMKFNTQIMDKLCMKRSIAPMDQEENKLDELKNAEPVQASDSTPAVVLPAAHKTQRKDSVHSRNSEDYHGSKHIFHHVKQGEFAHHFVKRNSIMVHLKHGEHHHNQFLQDLQHKASLATTTTSGSVPETDLTETGEPELTLRPIPCLCPINTYYPDKEGDTGCCAYPNLVLKWILFFISFPFMLLFTYTIPNCATPRFQKFYHLSFVMSIVWIAALSFAMVTLVTKTGCILNVDHYTMGLVIVAIGTSVPDALSSVLVARDGFGDMAVSNAIGSNVFDINLGLGLPYFIRNCLSSFAPVSLLTEHEVELREAGELPLTPHAKFGFILLLILALTLLTFTCVRFRLNWIVGVSFLSMYVLFLVYAFVQELLCDYNC